MKLLILSIFSLLLVSTSNGQSSIQTYDPTKTGEISTSQLTPSQLIVHNKKIEQSRQLIEQSRLCYGVYDDSGTYCRTSGLVGDTQVLGRRWGVLYDCLTFQLYMVWDL